MELTIIMPCLNEAETLAICIAKAQKSLSENSIDGEIIIADNGSTDGSQKIASDLGARVVDVEVKGYGAAIQGGIAAANGTYVIMGDADDSYDFSNLMPYVEKLRDGYDLVMGNRFRGGIADGAMPPLHRYLGNPVLTGIGRMFFKSDCRDFHCGLRGFRKQAALDMQLKCTGMEFASELVVKAHLHKMKITEVPTTLAKDGRSRPPHLRSWHDGWRHLRFLLLFSPRWLFLYPGFILMLVSGLLGLPLFFSDMTIGAATFSVQSLLFLSVFFVTGYQAILFALIARSYACLEGFLPESEDIKKFIACFSLERGLMFGLSLFLSGFILFFYLTYRWVMVSNFGFPFGGLRFAMLSTSLILIGLQTVSASFLLSLITMEK